MRQALRRILGLSLLMSCLASCRGSAPPQEGPIILITFDSLRADVVGGLGGERGLTPNLDALMRQASWAGRAIAPSSWGSPAMASLFTGLRPWQHQVLQEESRLAPALFTLPEALQALGYETSGFTGEAAYSKEGGYDQGFDRLEELAKGAAAAKRLERIGGRRRFVWIHIPEPQAPYFHRPRFDDRIDTGRLELPERVLPNQLALYFDPANPLPPARRRLFWAMYRFNVAWADDRLGRLIQALRSSGEWDRTLLVVTSTHGEEFGEKGQILNGGNLGRQLLEVPFAIKLPLGFRRKIAEPKEAADRLGASLGHPGGGRRRRGAASGGAQPVPARPGGRALRALPGQRHQPVLARRRRRSAPLGIALRAAAAGVLPGAPGDDEPGQRADRPRRAAGAAGRDPGPAARGIRRRPAAQRRRRAPADPRALGRRGGSQPLADPRRAAELARRLARTWNSFVPAQRTPGEEAREWYTAESP